MPSSWRLADGAVLATTFWLIVLVGALLHIVPVALAESLDTLPSQLGRWSADPRTVEESAYDEAWRGADQQLSRRYRTVDGRTAIVEVWYFASQGQDREIVSDRTNRLHANATGGTIALRDGRVLRVNVRREGNPEEVALFWYDVDGALEANPYAAKARSLWNALTARRSNAAAVLVRTRVGAAPADEAQTVAQDLAAEVHYALTSLWRTGSTGVDSPRLSSQASPR
jgi:EpsI family protein